MSELPESSLLMRAALASIYIAVDKSVAQDINNKVMDEIERLEKEIEQLQKDNERLREGIRKITKVSPPAFSNLSPIEVVAMSPHELIPHVKELLKDNSIGEDDE